MRGKVRNQSGVPAASDLNGDPESTKNLDSSLKRNTAFIKRLKQSLGTEHHDQLMKDIEILPDASGVPTVTLHGDAKAAAAAKGIVKVHVSLSHSEVCIRSRNV